MSQRTKLLGEGISSILSYINNANLKDQIAYALIFNIPKIKVTWDSVSLFASSLKTNARLYAMLRLLELSEIWHRLVGIHSFLGKYAAENKVNKEKAATKLIGSSKMIRAVAKKNPELLVESFTPASFSLEEGGQCWSKTNLDYVTSPICKRRRGGF